jgi:hypothetical protein
MAPSAHRNYAIAAITDALAPSHGGKDAVRKVFEGGYDAVPLCWALHNDAGWTWERVARVLTDSLKSGGLASAPRLIAVKERASASPPTQSPQPATPRAEARPRRTGEMVSHYPPLPQPVVYQLPAAWSKPAEPFLGVEFWTEGGVVSRVLIFLEPARDRLRTRLLEPPESQSESAAAVQPIARSRNKGGRPSARVKIVAALRHLPARETDTEEKLRAAINRVVRDLLARHELKREVSDDTIRRVMDDFQRAPE